MKVRCVLDAQAGLAEGPHWWVEKSVLIWVDIEASRVGFFDPVTGRNRFLVVTSHVGAVVPMSDGELLVATAQGFVRLHPDSGVVSSLHDPEDDQPGNRFNDGSVIPGGGFGPAAWPTTLLLVRVPFGGSILISAAFVNGMG